MEDKWNQTEARIRSWIKDNKALMSVSVLVGFLLTPFLWPFFLAVVYTALSLAVPVFLILLGIKMPWRAEPHKEKKDTEKDRPENSPKDEEEDTYEQRKDTFSQGQDSKNGAAPEPEHKEKKDCADRKNNDGERDAAISWYVQEGKVRILKLMHRACEENATGISIRRDGICSAKGKDGYYRIGAFRNFPGNRMEVIASQFRKEVPSVSVRLKGKYLCIFWKKEECA